MTKTPDELWAQTPELLGPDGLPYRKGGVAAKPGDRDAPTMANPDATRDLDRNEVRCPAFPESACPPAAQMLWLLERHSGTVPPWRLRVSGWVQARYGREAIARTLWPSAVVLWGLDPIDPTKGVEFNWPDQLDRSTDPT